ncbi:MAG TPA: outer membrane lipoprotein carrier protein LolA [Thermoanaerobaculia bacterium]|nr:outer membrane lipoprotein carrier protein LolA [Thermoanaerobaculia bacterium]
MYARLKRSGLALLLLLSLSPAVQAAKPAEKPDPRAPGLSGTQRLEALMERVRIEQQGVKTLEARFVQNRESSLLVAAEQSTGTFSYAVPGRVRWEYTSPNPISVVIDGSEMTTWYRDLKRAERLKIGRYSNQVMKYMGATGSTQTLLEYFKITLKVPDKTSDPYQLDLVPKFARVAKRVQAMTLWIDPKTFFPSRLRYVEGDGDVTEYQFKDLKINAQIPADRFVLKIPQGVETRVIDLDQKADAKDKAKGSGR